jgi:hypothetical protein
VWGRWRNFGLEGRDQGWHGASGLHSSGIAAKCRPHFSAMSQFDVSDPDLELMRVKLDDLIDALRR